jgi:hypothetical protein
MVMGRIFSARNNRIFSARPGPKNARVYTKSTTSKCNEKKTRLVGFSKCTRLWLKVLALNPSSKKITAKFPTDLDMTCGAL